MQDKVTEVKMAADSPNQLASEARSHKMDAEMRAKRIASGDLTEASRTARDVDRLKETLGAEDLELELPDDRPDPDDGGTPA